MIWILFVAVIVIGIGLTIEDIYRIRKKIKKKNNDKKRI